MNIFSKATWLCLILLLTLPFTAFGEIHHLKIPSKALVDSTRIIIATPANFNLHQAGGYPFIIMLHGWSGDETQWEADADLQLFCDRYKILLVLPDGGYDGWWIDAKRLPGRNYDTHIHREVPQWVISEFNGSNDPAKHGILGLSMGGYGTVMQALLYPHDYAAASSLSGVMNILLHPKSWGLKLALGEFEDNLQNWRDHNPVDLAKQANPDDAPAVLLICGRDDFTFEENVAMADILKEHGYPVKFMQDEGAHSHTFWKQHVGTAIDFIVTHFH